MATLQPTIHSESADTIGTRLAEAVGLGAHPPAELSQFLADLSDRERVALALLLKQRQGLDPAAIIGALPAAAVLNDAELTIFEAERTREVSCTPAPSARFTVVMKATRLCNLRCTYCHSWAEGPDQTMTFAVLARTIRETTGMPGVRSLSYYWHGGEPTLLKPKFFKKLIWLQQRLKQPGQRVTNYIQTNGTHLTEEWLDFLVALGMGVGVSLDGPPEVHDSRRLTAAGGASSQLVRASLEKLQERNIPFGVLVVVDQQIAAVPPERLLAYLVELGVRSVHFLSVVPQNNFDGDGPDGSYLPFDEFVTFLVALFRTWAARFAERITITDFEEFIGAIRSRQRPVQCLWSGDCADKFITVEANGDITSCDRQIGTPHSSMGNVLARPVADVIRGAPFVRFSRAESRRAKEQMQSCKWFAQCQGGCPHDRLLNRRLRGLENQTCCGMRPLLDEIEQWLEPRSG